MSSSGIVYGSWDSAIVQTSDRCHSPTLNDTMICEDNLFNGPSMSLEKERLKLLKNEFCRDFLKVGQDEKKNFISLLSKAMKELPTSWTNVLAQVLGQLPKKVIVNKVSKVVVRKSHSALVQTRIFTAAIVGSLARMLTGYPGLNDLNVNITISLCQDEHPDVQIAIIGNLADIIPLIQDKHWRDRLMMEYIALCHSEDTPVRNKAFEVLCDMLNVAGVEFRKRIMIQEVQNYFKKEMELSSTLLPVLAKEIGRTMYILCEELTTDQMKSFVEIYQKMSTVGIDDEFEALEMMPVATNSDLITLNRTTRCGCAYNAPALVLCASGRSPHYHYVMVEILVSFIRDPHQDVCLPVVAGFHEICRLFGNQIYLLEEVLLMILRSNNKEIVYTIIPDICIIFKMFDTHSSKWVSFSAEFVLALIEADKCLGRSLSWRYHQELLQQLSLIVQCLPPSVILQYIVPLLRTNMHAAKNLLCRLEAARTFLICLDSKFVYSYHETDLCAMLVEDFCDNPSFKKRMMFLQICELAMGIVSNSFFKNFFLFHMLSLFADNVSNVRRKLAEMLPSVKSYLSLPEDSVLLQKFNIVVEYLANDKSDPNVKESMLNTLKLENLQIDKNVPTSQDDSSSDEDSDYLYEDIDDLPRKQIASSVSRDLYEDIEGSPSKEIALSDSRDLYEDMDESPSKEIALPDSCDLNEDMNESLSKQIALSDLCDLYEDINESTSKQTDQNKKTDFPTTPRGKVKCSLKEKNRRLDKCRVTPYKLSRKM